MSSIIKTLPSIITLTLLFLMEASAQVIWNHKTSDVWLNPQTEEVDSSICFTNMSCCGDNCTAAAILFNYPINPVGRLAFYRSNDGGQSWFEQPLSLPVDPPDIINLGMEMVQQIDSLNFVACGGRGVVIRTTDGGLTWRRTDLPTEQKITSIHFSDPLNGIATCEGTDNAILTTTDGGDHWTPHSFHFHMSGHSYGKGKFSFHRYGYGPIYTTVDNFETLDSVSIDFDPLASPKHRYVFSRIFYSSDDLIFAVGAFYPADTVVLGGTYALIMRSLDAGKTWEKPWTFPTPVMSGITRLSSLDRDTIFVGGWGSRYLISTDRGETWRADTVILDTNYESTEVCLGMELSNDGHPIGIFGNGGFRVTSIITRGVYSPAKVELIERVRYFTYFYPNPSTGIVNIETIDKSGSPVTIIDILGRPVIKTNLSKEGKLTVDLSHLQPGLYNVVFDYMGIVFIAGRIILVH